MKCFHKAQSNGQVFGKTGALKEFNCAFMKGIRIFPGILKIPILYTHGALKAKNKSGQKSFVFHMFPVLLVQPAVLDNSKKFSKQYESFGRKAGPLYLRLVTRNSKFSFSLFSYFSFNFRFLLNICCFHTNN